MKIISSLRSALLVSSLAVAFGSAVQAADLGATVARQLNTQGEVAVHAAGPYVEVGSYRIWVSSHLGRPAVVLQDGTWLYRDFSVSDSQVGGTLAVSFSNDGRVAAMKLLSGVRVAELTSHKAQTGLIAAR